jgi:hypothetical protein
MADNQTQPRVHIGVFGKHPGWDDFFSLGLDTDFLLHAQDVLLVQGVGSNLQSGAWAEQDEDRIHELLERVFIWSRTDGTAVGLVWPSEDSKGRRFPLFACADYEGMSPDEVVEVSMPHLRALRQECEEATRRTEVISATDHTLKKLRQVPQSEHSLETVHRIISEAGAINEVATELRDDDPDRLYRVFYEFREKAEPFYFQRYAELRERDESPPPAHVRLPAAGDGPLHDARLWTWVMRSQIGPAAPLLVLAPDQGDWVDLILGDPTGEELYCLGLPRAEIPVAADVPYKIDDAFRRQVDEALEAARGDGQFALSIFEAEEEQQEAVAARTAGKSGTSPPSTATTDPEQSRVGGKHGAAAGSGKRSSSLGRLRRLLRRFGLWAGIAAVVLATALVGLYILFSQTPQQAPATHSVEWQSLCQAECNWSAQFREDAQSRFNPWQKDAWLAREVVQPLREARKDGTELSPGGIIDRPGGDVCGWARGENMPRNARERGRQVKSAWKVVGGLRNALLSAPQQWPRLQRLKGFEQMCVKRGWENSRQKVATLFDQTDELHVELAAALDAVLAFPRPPQNDPFERLAALREQYPRLLKAQKITEPALRHAAEADRQDPEALVETLNRISERISALETQCKRVSQKLADLGRPEVKALVESSLPEEVGLEELTQTLRETETHLSDIHSGWTNAVKRAEKIGLPQPGKALMGEPNAADNPAELARKVKKLSADMQEVASRRDELLADLDAIQVAGLTQRAKRELADAAGEGPAAVREKINALQRTGDRLAATFKQLRAVTEAVKQKAGKSRVLAEFPQYVEANKKLGEKESLGDLAERLASIVELGKRLETFLAGDWQKQDVFARRLFLENETEEAPLPTDAPNAETFNTWLEKTDRYYWLEGFPETRAEWQEKLNKTRRILDVVEENLSERPQHIRTAHKRVESDYADLTEKENQFSRGIRKNRGEVTEAKVGELTRKTRQLLEAASELRLPPACEWWQKTTDRRDIRPNRSHVNETWLSRRDAILQEAENCKELEKNQAKYQAMYTRISRLGKRLEEVAGTLPDPLDLQADEPWQARLQEAALASRKTRVGRFLKNEIPWDHNVPGPVERYRQKLTALAKDLTDNHETIRELVENLGETLRVALRDADAEWQQELLEAARQREKDLRDEYVSALAQMLRTGQTLSPQKAKRDLQAVAHELSDATESVRVLLGPAEELEVTFEPTGDGWQQKLKMGLEQKKQVLLTKEANAAKQALKGGKRLSPADTKARVADLSDQFAGWQQKLAQAATDFTRLERMLNLHFRWGEPDAEGRTIAALYKRLFEADPSQTVKSLLAFSVKGSAATDLSQPLKTVQSTLLDLARRAATRRQVEDAPDGDALAAMVEGEDDAVALCAWRRLGDRPFSWPDNLAQLRRENGWTKKITRIHSRLPEKRRAQIDVVGERKRRWNACVAKLDSPPHLHAAIELHRECGIEPDAGAGWIRYDILLARLFDMSGTEAKTARMAREAENIVESMEALPGDVRNIKEVDRFMAALEDLLKKWEDGKIKAAPEAGPDTVGWANWQRDMCRFPQRLTYRWPEKGHELIFVRVEPKQGDPAYLCTTEVPVGLFVDVVEASGKLDLIADHLNKNATMYTGARTWQIDEDTGGVKASNSWLGRHKSLSPDVSLYPSGLKVKSPDEMSPMQQISAEGATAFAELLGCRIPRLSEYLAAYSHESGDRLQPGRWNLRDRTWASYSAHTTKLRNNALLVSEADAGAFSADGQRDNDDAYDSHDGAVWFQSVHAGKARIFHHLIGNVAEYVSSSKTGRLHYVVGGSALSPPHAGPATENQVSLTAKYSDVGFRLALSSPGNSFHLRLEEILRQSAVWLTVKNGAAHPLQPK